MDYLDKAKWVLDNEIAGLQKVRDELGEDFLKLIKLCQSTYKNDGKMIICGVGKSGHIGRKIAATLSSTGSPAVFLHPVEAMHGDLGVLQSADLLIVISYSGESTEALEIIPSAKRLNVPTVGISGNAKSTMADFVDLPIKVSVDSEACPFNLAPTSSTTATLAFGDALAIVLMEARKFNKDDYAALHPSGAIGRSITLKIKDVMRSGDRAPLIQSGSTVKDSLMKMTSCRAGSVMVVDVDNQLKGIFTDGDFRRHAQENLDVLNQPIESVMTANPITLNENDMAIVLLKLLEERNINDIPVIDDSSKAVGLVDIQDLPKFKLM